MSAVAATDDLASTERALRLLELEIGRKLDGFIQGEHPSAWPGPGSDAGEARAYEPGDDVRRIDWSLTARSGGVAVRDTLAERELETWFVVDGSASLDFGTARVEKRDLAASVVAAFGFLTVRAGNRFASVISDGVDLRTLPPRTGRSAVVDLVTRLRRRPRGSGQAATLADALARVRRLARRPGLVVVVSDLLDDSDWGAELRRLSARHEVIVAQVTDPREDNLPDVGVLALVDPETGERREVQTSSRRLRERYAQAAASRRAGIDDALRAGRAEVIRVGTDEDWLRSVVRHVAGRRRRSTRRARR